MSADIQSEILAVSSYLRILNEAQDCKRLYEKAGVALPEPLKRLLGEEEAQIGPQQMSLGIGRPDTDMSRKATKPSEADEKWISLRAKDASPTTVAMAILRSLNEPIRAKDLADQVTSILPNIVGGSIYNLLNRLEVEGQVTRSENGWILVKGVETGILSQTYLWAPRNLLTKQDLAAHRREAIIYILRNEGSMQVMEIVEKLHEWEWVQAPVNKDLLKTDMQVLEEQGLAKRIPDSRNWEAASRY